MSDPVVLSVVLCAHNSKQASLQRVLHALDLQSLPKHLWELVIVDNSSNPPLSERALELPGNARVIVEQELGLTPARIAGFRNAIGQVLVMIDDDTVPDPGYLENSLRLLSDHPEIGAAGGRIRGEFETATEPWMNGYLDLLAIRDFGDKPIRALIDNRVGPWEPCGAGMVLRKEVALTYAERTTSVSRKRLDRSGASLSSCGDTDLARTASDLGFYLAYEPSLSLVHLIPAGRLRVRYLARLAFCVQRDGWLLSRLRGEQCTLDGWRRWAHLVVIPLKSASPNPRRWLLKAASAYGQVMGRSLPLQG